jgi:hypothetical protein
VRQWQLHVTVVKDEDELVVGVAIVGRGEESGEEV